VMCHSPRVRLTIDDDDSDDDGEASAIIAGLEEVTMTAAAPNPAHAPPRASPPVSPFYQDDYVESYLNTVDELTLQSVRTILLDVERQLQSPSLPGRPALDGITPDMITTVTLATLTDNPFFTVLHRDRTHAIIRLPTGRIVSCHAQDVDRARTAYLPPPSAAQVRHDSPTIDTHDDYYDDECLESPLPAPARFHRAPTPRYLPASPASPPESSSSTLPHPDITYDLTAPRRVARPVSTRDPAPATYKEESSSVSVPARPYPRPQFAPHNCLPLDGVLPHPPFHPDPPMWGHDAMAPDPFRSHSRPLATVPVGG
jgi:hypothetical protein